MPSTGMWRGEVFAISDCLVVVVLRIIYEILPCNPPLIATYIFSPDYISVKCPKWQKQICLIGSFSFGRGGPNQIYKQAFMEFLVSPAFISTLNIHKHVGLSHVKCVYEKNNDKFIWLSL